MRSTSCAFSVCVLSLEFSRNFSHLRINGQSLTVHENPQAAEGAAARPGPITIDASPSPDCPECFADALMQMRFRGVNQLNAS
jgi:hypothetical protein